MRQTPKDGGLLAKDTNPQRWFKDGGLFCVDFPSYTLFRKHWPNL